MRALPVYIGHDSREPEATAVCEASLLRRSSMPLHIVRMDRQAICEAGFHSRPFERRDGGQRIDIRDGKPFSTDFSFTRFLVPALSLYQGWALFCDGDFLFTADVAGLFGLANAKYAAMCVKHQHVPAEAVKMDGMEQTRYHRKNWSSLTLWNCAHPANRHVGRPCVNKMSGGWLHAFSWLKDELIGELPMTWNHLVGVNESVDELPCGLHFTEGIPTMPGYENTPYADLWRAELGSRRGFAGPRVTEYERGRAA